MLDRPAKSRALKISIGIIDGFPGDLEVQIQ
jgi:hypothetical protein